MDTHFWIVCGLAAFDVALVAVFFLFVRSQSQVSGRNQLSWEERFDLDVWYVDHRSFWLDVRILLRTVRKVIIGEGVAQPGHETAAEFMGSPAGTHTRRTHGG